MAHGSTRSSVGVRRISSSRTSALRCSSPVTVRFWDYLAVGRERETVARRGVDWKKPKKWIVAKNCCDVPGWAKDTDVCIRQNWLVPLDVERHCLVRPSRAFRMCSLQVAVSLSCGGVDLCGAGCAVNGVRVRVRVWCDNNESKPASMDREMRQMCRIVGTFLCFMSLVEEFL